jgi:hypothetical protein
MEDKFDINYMIESLFDKEEKISLCENFKKATFKSAQKGTIKFVDTYEGEVMNSGHIIYAPKI